MEKSRPLWAVFLSEKKLVVAVVGATGAVGREMLKTLSTSFGSSTEHGSHDQQNCKISSDITVERIGKCWKGMAKKKWNSF